MQRTQNELNILLYTIQPR